ncbi:MAG: hypothetical protein AVDCRST_MAG76-3038 [uncultured Acidimicrobiales bacterium]|uniref:CobQ/CobB/MinD/ParA nucleotide binding domain-containing protein n=1 Tax=uncultured Acidimicrobiales bacterium TaxID=310071 RepID=A0A6J4J2I4_9ACTN|nr:MAG: hypothetical protein AVDCRST_MAG76-3038 [uncultured Acidimicrobiales bacterium]
MSFASPSSTSLCRASPRGFRRPCLGSAVLITCWSSKGGSGTTVVAAALATLMGTEDTAALLVDLGGDLPAALGLPEPATGLTGWVEGEDLAPLVVRAGLRLRLLPRGPGPLPSGIGPGLAAALAGQPAVVDAGVIGGTAQAGAALDLAAVATASLLVVRPCFLALRRAVAAPLRPSGVVLVSEPERVLGPADVEAALGVPVVAVVPWDPTVARRVDSGLLGSALPRGLASALRRAA